MSKMPRINTVRDVKKSLMSEAQFITKGMNALAAQKHAPPHTKVVNARTPSFLANVPGKSNFDIVIDSDLVVGLMGQKLETFC